MTHPPGELDWRDCRSGELPTVRYTTLDNFRGYPVTELTSPVPGPSLDHLATRGYLHLRNVLGTDDCGDLAARLDRLVAHEIGTLGAQLVLGNGYYVRDLVYKDAEFTRFLAWEPMLELARLMLGPRVRSRVDSRVALTDESGVGVPWHIHFPGATHPPPPWFSTPHALHLLVYLDQVGTAEGALEVVPGSHLSPLRPEDATDEATVQILPRAGDCVAMHGNLLHRTRPTADAPGPRHVLFIGYTAAWVVGDTRAGGQPLREHERPVDPAAHWHGTRAELDDLL